MAVKVGINGFGRIGRNILRAALGSADIDIVAVNDLTSAGTLAHLLKYDSVLGVLPQTIKATKGGISVDGDELRVLRLLLAELPCRRLRGIRGGLLTRGLRGLAERHGIFHREAAIGPIHRGDLHHQRHAVALGAARNQESLGRHRR